MRLRDELRLLVRISRTAGIARRYFVTNGFDGALTMLGLLVGLRVAGPIDLSIALQACLGAAVALMMSGLSSAYVSESAERRRELRELEQAMVTDLTGSAHARAAVIIPWLVAAVNGMAPFLISLTILTPLWFAQLSSAHATHALDLSIGVAFVIMALLGVFLGRVSGTWWLWSAARTLAVGVITVALILLLKL